MNFSYETWNSSGTISGRILNSTNKFDKKASIINLVIDDDLQNTYNYPCFYINIMDLDSNRFFYRNKIIDNVSKYRIISIFNDILSFRIFLFQEDLGNDLNFYFDTQFPIFYINIPKQKLLDILENAESEDIILRNKIRPKYILLFYFLNDWICIDNQNYLLLNHVRVWGEHTKNAIISSPYTYIYDLKIILGTRHNTY